MKKVNSIEIRAKESTIDCLVLEKKIKAITKFLRGVKLSDYSNMEKKNLRDKIDCLMSAICDMEA